MKVGRNFSKIFTNFKILTIKAPSRKPAVCCCVVVAAAYTNRGGRPGPPECGFKVCCNYNDYNLVPEISGECCDNHFSILHEFLH